MHTPILALSFPGTTEWIIIGFVALLLFGRRLPDVARSVGKSITEFKKGMKDIKDDIDEGADEPKRIAPPKDKTPELPANSTTSDTATSRPAEPANRADGAGRTGSASGGDSA